MINNLLGKFLILLGTFFLYNELEKVVREEDQHNFGKSTSPVARLSSPQICRSVIILEQSSDGE